MDKQEMSQDATDDTKYPSGISQEVEVLLRFYSGKKLISVKSIIEFSKTYNMINDLIRDHIGEAGK